MILTLESTWRTELLLQPACSAQGKLEGLQIIVNLIGVDGHIHTPAGQLLAQLPAQTALTLFSEQLALLESCKLFFIQHSIPAWINITPVIAGALLSDAELAANVERFPFLGFSINENYPDLNKGAAHPQLSALAERYSLMLENFGAGKSSTRAVFDGLFKQVILDKNFVHHRLTSRSFEPFMRAVVSQVKPYCQSIIIDGIDNEFSRQRVLPFHFSAMMGALWPPVTVADLTTLVQG